MDVKKQAASSGSDGSPLSGVIDEKKRKRMLSNRESARRSRIKKQKQMDDLIGQVSQLRSENDQMMQKIAATEQSYMYVAAERDVLQAEAMALSNRLQSLNEFIFMAEEVHELAVDIPEIPESFVEPWQLPCQAPQFTASANMFHC
uniref:BZIP domain-containing protein n=1 Tax=Kalanchoe fedtschenkoi TaxID=63787 RepID=A0A7N0SVH7_KALFE